MAGFFKKLFGGGDGGSSEPEDAGSRPPDAIHKDIEVRAAPMKEADGQFRIAGTLTRITENGQDTRRFVRADLVQGKDEAVRMTIEKARMIIDQNGAYLWQGDPDHPV